MSHRLIALGLLLGLLNASPAGARAPIEVVVTDPYIDLHTGPGRGYPVTQSVERGVTIELIRQRTDWIEVRTARGQRGWVHRSQLQNTLTPSGETVQIAGPRPDARTEHEWEVGVATGEFDGGSLVSTQGAYVLTNHLLVRADVAQVMGKDSNDWLGTVGLAHVFMPQWPIAPFVGVGGGWLHVSPKESGAKDHTDPTVYGSLGFRGYLSDQFLLQAEYRGFVVFPSHGDNEEIDEWLVGFTYFF